MDKDNTPLYTFPTVYQIEGRQTPGIWLKPTPEGVTIRDATLRDVHAMPILHASAVDSAYVHPDGENSTTNATATNIRKYSFGLVRRKGPDYWAQSIEEEGKNIHYLAESNGVLLGLARLCLPETGIASDAVTEVLIELDSDYLANFAQGLGVGSTLARHFVTETEKLGKGGLYSCMTSWTPAVGFYLKSCGAKIIVDQLETKKVEPLERLGITLEQSGILIPNHNTPEDPSALAALEIGARALLMAS